MSTPHEAEAPEIRDEPLHAVLYGWAVMFALVWLPLLVVYIHFFVAPVSAFGQVMTLGGALVGGWIAARPRLVLPLILAAVVYAVAISGVISSIPAERLEISGWSILLALGELNLIAAAIARYRVAL